jgi:phosphomannomutase
MRRSNRRLAASPDEGREGERWKVWIVHSRVRRSSMKRLVAFDLDGTLAEPKQMIDDEMAKLLARLSAPLDVAIISGGDWPQFEQQILSRLPADMTMTRVHLLPTSGAKRYRFQDGSWTLADADLLTATEHGQIRQALTQAMRDCGLPADGPWGDIIEDRGSQITFSGLGQHAPLEKKRAWDPDFTKRRRLQAALVPTLPLFSISIGGSTSIDITKQGVDKGYGMTRLAKAIDMPIDAMMFVGDALFAGGNDYPVHAAGFDTLEVRDVAETKCLIAALLMLGDW